MVGKLENHCLENQSLKKFNLLNIYILPIPIFFMKKGKLATVVRYLLGIAMAFFGLNGFFQFANPPQLSQAGLDFFIAIINTGYLSQFINIIFIVVAIMLLSNKYVPLSLVLLFPIMLNVVLFHLFLDVASGAMGFIVFILNVYLMMVHADSYRPLLRK